MKRKIDWPVAILAGAMFVGIMMLSAAAITLRGFVIAVLWAIFVAPFFPVPSIGVAQAVGIFVIAGLMTAPPVHDPDDGMLRTIRKGVLRSLTGLAIAIVAAGFMGVDPEAMRAIGVGL